MFVLRDVDEGREQLRPLEDLRRLIVAGAAEMAAYQAQWLELVAEFDEREGWKDEELISCAHWLAWRCGLDLRTAREHVRVARALRSLPEVRARFAAAQLTYSKVRAVCRVATAANEAMLVEWATTLTASQLDKVVAAYDTTHAAPLTLEDEAERRAKCGVTTWTDSDGLHHTEIVSPPEEGLVIDLAIDYGRAEHWKETKAPARGPQGRLDSLLLVLRRGLVNAERGVMDESRHLIITHLREASAWIDGDGNIDLGNGAVVHPKVLQRLGCDAIVQGMLDGLDGSPLDLGRRSRTTSRDQKVALMAQYPTCEWPGCGVKSKGCQFHHLEFWTNGGRTDLDNIRPACSRHHHLVHEGGWKMVIGHDGRVVVIPPDGREPLVGAPMLSRTPVAKTALVARNRSLGIVPAEDAAECLFGRAGGERMTAWALGAIVDGLVACGPPAGAAGTSSGQGLAANPDDVQRPSVDLRLVGGSPPSPN